MKLRIKSLSINNLPTGGDNSGPALAGLEEIFLNPKNFNILPYYHNHFENGEYRLTGFFIPAYSCLPPLMDSRGVTNQEKAKEHYNKIRAQKVSTPKNWLEYCSEFCFYPEEALSKQGENQFDQVKIAEQITEVKILKNTPKTLKVGKLTWNYKDNSEEIIGVTFRPDPNGNIIVLEEPLTDDIGKPFEGLYVGGIDSIDHAEGDSVVGSDGSKFAITIKKRTFGNEGNKYVCMYIERPKDVRTAYENAAKILWWYGCKANLEDTKIGFRMYLQERKLLYKMLMKRPVSAQSSIKRSSTLWGTPGSEKMIQHGLDLVAQYVDDFYFNIWFIDMLEQLQKFSYEAKGRFDIILAMVYTEIADEDMMGIVVKKDNPMQSDWEEYGEIGWFTDSRGYKYFGYEKQYDNYSSERNPRIHSNIF